MERTLGRSPGLGLNLLTAPSRPVRYLCSLFVLVKFLIEHDHEAQTQTPGSDLRSGFRRLYSGGTAPDSHRTSLTPKAPNDAKAITEKKCCQEEFFAGREA